MTEPLKICVAIASRNRPSALVGAIMAAHRLQSGENMVAFTVAIDTDDVLSQQILAIAARDEASIMPVIANRSPYLGGAQNRAIAAAKDADLTVLLSDRTYMISPAWDAILAEAHRAHPNRILWLSSPNDHDTVIPALPRSLLEIVDWKYSPETHVYWFDDTGWMEIDRMASKGPSLKVRAMYSGFRAKTTRLRELEFWTKLFIHHRPKRIALAKEISTKLGLAAWSDPSPEMIADFTDRDAALLTNAAKIEEIFGDPTDPGPEYLLARVRAEEMMAEAVA